MVGSFLKYEKLWIQRKIGYKKKGTERQTDRQTDRWANGWADGRKKSNWNWAAKSTFYSCSWGPPPSSAEKKRGWKAWASRFSLFFKAIPRTNGELLLLSASLVKSIITSLKCNCGRSYVRAPSSTSIPPLLCSGSGLSGPWPSMKSFNFWFCVQMSKPKVGNMQTKFKIFKYGSRSSFSLLPRSKFTSSYN